MSADDSAVPIDRPDDWRHQPPEPPRTLLGTPTSWRPGPLTRLNRRRSLHWIAAVALAATAAVLVHRAGGEARALVDGYGRSATVWVSDAPIERGDSLAGRSRLAELPIAAIPDDALATTGPIEPEQLAATAISAGSVLTRLHVATDSVIGADEAAFTLPVDASTPPVIVGDPILVVIHDDPYAARVGALIEGRIRDRDDDRITIIVRREQLGTVSAAVHGGGIGLAMAGS